MGWTARCNYSVGRSGWRILVVDCKEPMPDLTKTEADASKDAFRFWAHRQEPTLSVAIRRNLSSALTALVRNLRGLRYLSGPAVTVMQPTKPWNGLRPQSAPCKGDVVGSISVVNRRLSEICTVWSGRVVESLILLQQPVDVQSAQGDDVIE